MKALNTFLLADRQPHVVAPEPPDFLLLAQASDSSQVPIQNTQPVQPQASGPAGADPAALLASLRDIHLPETTGSALAPGWLLLGGVAALLISMLVFYLWRRRRIDDWRQVAQQELALINEDAGRVPEAETLAACSRLLRRVSLALAPRREVASMTGEHWLGLLDSLHRSSEFSTGPGRVLADQPYRRPPERLVGQTATAEGNQGSETEDAQALLSLLDDFINNAESVEA